MSTINDADFAPTKPTFKDVVYMSIRNLTNFPYIEKDFDAITDYELLCKVVEHLNNLISNNNTQNSTITGLYNAYVELQDYVNNYFDDLDVQDEINNKLESMANSGELTNLIAGYIQPRIDAQNEEISNFETTINNSISEINGRINSVASGSPLVASNTSEMTDTSRVYVNTTDGKWYYYDGDSWEIGGTYQASELGDGSVTFLKLDENLNNLILKNIQFLNQGDIVTGHYITIDNNDDSIIINNNIYWGYSVIDISSYQNKLLYYNTNTFGTNYGLIITDTSNIALWHSSAGVGGDYTISNGIITVPATAKYLYLQENIADMNSNNSSTINRHIFHNVGIFTNFKNIINYNEKSSLTNIDTLDNYYLNSSNQSINGIPSLSYLATGSWSTQLYKINKGIKYEIHGNNYQSSVSFVITNNNYIIKSKSTTSYSSGEEFVYEFTASEDGYIVTCGNTSNTTTVYIYDHLSTDESQSLSEYKAGYTGDSICYGLGYTGGYAKILYDNYGLTYDNIGVSGGHISHDRDDVFIISNSIPSIDSDIDVLIMEGGINDYSNYVPTGTLTGNYTDAIDQTKFTGALEKLFRDAVSYFPNIPKAFLIIHNVNQSKVKLPNDIHRTEYPNGEIIDFQYFVDIIYKVANKYGIEVIDIGKNAGMNTYNQTIKDTYTAITHGSHDGLHPNESGYKKFYVPYIKEWLNKVLK